MFTYPFSRLPVVLTRILIVMALLPWMVGARNDARPGPVSNESEGGLPQGWSAGEWKQVVDKVQADVSVERAQLATAWDQRKNLIAGDATSTVAFGYSVAVDGDILVVGAINGLMGGYNCGTVYVFEKSASGWSTVNQVAKLYPQDYASAHYFGFSVAIDGDKIVVGAPDSHKPYAGTPGSAYVFKRTGTDWTQAQKLSEASPSASDTPRFGFSVDIDGDLIVVGAPMEDLSYDGSSHADQGSAYVFQIPLGEWPGTETNEDGYLRPTDGREGDMFGASVAVSGHTVIAGGYAHEPDPDNPAESFYGKAYIFSQSDPWGNANEVAQFTASDAADHEYFGWSVALDGDLAIVGAPGETTFDKNGEESVYLFKRPVSGWSGNYTETARLTTSDGNMFYDLGVSVAVSGNTVVAGAPWTEINEGSKTGAVYVYVEPAGGWTDMLTETQKLVAVDHAGGDEFGHFVAIDGTAIAIGVPVDNGRFGSAYMFDSTPQSWINLYLPLIVR